MSDHDPAVERLARLRQLHDEIDRQRDAAAERARSVDNKASFLVVGAGVIVPAALIQRGVPVALAVLPLLFALIALALATVALWPRRRLDLGPEKIYDLFFDSEAVRSEMESRIVRMKVDASVAREHRVRILAGFTSVGFVSLICAVAALIAIVVVGGNQ